MNNKILLLSVSVLAIGLFAMPSTLSLFAGQHTFDAGVNVSCNKCHQDIYDELSGTTSTFGVSTAHKETQDLKDCKGCHRGGNVSGFATKASTLGYLNLSIKEKGAHSAVTLECIACHDKVVTNLTNSSEAHGPFYNESITNSTAPSGKNNGTLLKGGNEACIGCHTHTNIKITWRRSTGIDMIVNESTNGTYTIRMWANTSSNVTSTFRGNVTATP